MSALLLLLLAAVLLLPSANYHALSGFPLDSLPEYLGLLALLPVIAWPWLRNQGPGGQEIRLAGQRYRFGVVLFPRTRLTYQLDGRFDVFEAVIGMEDAASARAHAVFRILGDGRVLLDSGPITHESEPKLVKVPIAQVRRLTLEADFGKDFDLGDVCVFAMPRVLKN